MSNEVIFLVTERDKSTTQKRLATTRQKFARAHCKRTHHCIVGCYMLRPFAHPVACCCVLLRKVWNRSNFSANNSQHFFCSVIAEAWRNNNVGGKLIEISRECHQNMNFEIIKRLRICLRTQVIQSTVITFSGFPEHWIIFSKFTWVRRSNDGLLDSTV